MTETARKKKLIEVALPLDAINAACKADKDRKTGTIRNLHKWFAPMPLPAWRALLFAALADDPEDDNHRVYLLDLIERLVKNGADLPDTSDLAEARTVLAQQYPDGLPVVMDPFCGGGSTLVEAQRLGMETYGSDLNPVPVLISRVVSGILPEVAGQQGLQASVGASRVKPGELFAAIGSQASPYSGLVADVRHYAEAIERDVRARLESHYPSNLGESTVAWIWARTTICPNPACGFETVLTTSWWLSKKKNDFAWIEPSVVAGSLELKVRQEPKLGLVAESPKTARGANFTCVACANTISEAEVDARAAQQGLGLRLVAVVAEKGRRRIYREPTEREVSAARVDLGDLDIPDGVAVSDGGNRRRFGLNTQADLYTPRQLLTLSAFADEVAATYDRVLRDGGTPEWARAVTAVLALAVGRLAMSNSSQARVTIRNDGTTTRFNAAFGRNDLPMTWDFPELNPLGESGTWLGSMPTILDSLDFLPSGVGRVDKADARVVRSDRPSLVATDPPYFDAIGYADLSDYFYVWHRRCLRRVFPDLYGTLATPKTNELTALPSHHGNSKDAARKYFIDGFTETFVNLQQSMAPDLPLLVVYASKEQKGGVEEETRWSSILTAMIAADLEITATWPIHGTGSTRMIGQGANAVASYIVMACRPRVATAGPTSLTDFNRALRRELGPAVRDLQAASILPIDLAQAAMGPGMQIFSRYPAVLDQQGSGIGVDHALRLINAALAEVLEEQEGELDAVSRFAARWWDSHAWEPAAFGEADKAARPLGISVDEVVRAQVATSQANKVQLLGRDSLDREWTPTTDALPTAWEVVHHLVDRLVDGGGELEAARLMARVGTLRDPAMALAYRLHSLAVKRSRTADQERYNALISSWSELIRLSGDGKASAEGLF